MDPCGKRPANCGSQTSSGYVICSAGYDSSYRRRPSRALFRTSVGLIRLVKACHVDPSNARIQGVTATSIGEEIRVHCANDFVGLALLKHVGYGRVGGLTQQDVVAAQQVVPTRVGCRPGGRRPTCAPRTTTTMAPCTSSGARTPPLPTKRVLFPPLDDALADQWLSAALPSGVSAAIPKVK